MHTRWVGELSLCSSSRILVLLHCSRRNLTPTSTWTDHLCEARLHQRSRMIICAGIQSCSPCSNSSPTPSLPTTYWARKEELDPCIIPWCLKRTTGTTRIELARICTWSRRRKRTPSPKVWTNSTTLRTAFSEKICRLSARKTRWTSRCRHNWMRRLPIYSKLRYS